MIAALAELYAASGDRKYLDEAERATEWVKAHRALVDGGFNHDSPHDEHDAAGPYLDDTLAMGQAYLALYRATKEKRWLEDATAAMTFIAANFGARNGVGYLTSKEPTDRYSQVFAERDENIGLARFANALYRETGDAKARAVTEQTMRYLVTPAIATRPLSGGELLAVYETTHAAASGAMPHGPVVARAK